jgi:hypothetical protein
MAMKILKRLARAAAKYDVKPEDIGPISTFRDDDYMAKYLGSMKRWAPPSFYGCKAKHRERARREWDKVIAKVETTAQPRTMLGLRVLTTQPRYPRRTSSPPAQHRRQLEPTVAVLFP